MKKLKKEAHHKVRESGPERQIAQELSDSEIARVAGGAGCTWFEQGSGWITHSGYVHTA